MSLVSLKQFTNKLYLQIMYIKYLYVKSIWH